MHYIRVLNSFVYYALNRLCKRNAYSSYVIIKRTERTVWANEKAFLAFFVFVGAKNGNRMALALHTANKVHSSYGRTIILLTEDVTY